MVAYRCHKKIHKNFIYYQPRSQGFSLFVKGKSPGNEVDLLFFLFFFYFIYFFYFKKNFI